MFRRVTNTRIAAVASALAAGVLAAFALRSSPATTGTATHVNQQAAEVRTQVIRRTVHIVRHERPPRGHATHALSSRAGAVPGNSASVVGSPPRTAASGSRSGAPSAPAATSAPRTRTSGAVARPTPSTSGSAPAPARTRTSGQTSGGAPSGGGPAKSGSGAPVRTRTSGASAGGGSGSGAAVRTRTSGGGEDKGGKGHDD